MKNIIITTIALLIAFLILAVIVSMSYETLF